MKLFIILASARIINEWNSLELKVVFSLEKKKEFFLKKIKEINWILYQEKQDNRFQQELNFQPLNFLLILLKSLFYYTKQLYLKFWQFAGN